LVREVLLPLIAANTPGLLPTSHILMKTIPSLGFRSARHAAWILFALLLGNTSARSDIVFAWNELMLHLTAQSPAPIAPQLEARVFAMAHLAMDEAIAAVSGPRMDAEAKKAAQRAAATSAAHDVLVHLLPEGTSAIDALAKRHLNAIAESDDKRRGIECGRAAASRVLTQRELDGWVELAQRNPTTADRSETAAALLARGEKLPPSPWLQVVPFALKSAEQFPVREVRTLNGSGEMLIDHALSSSSLFDRVDRVGALEARERLWSQHPVLAWNRIARQVCVGRTVDIAQQATLLAVLNLALADATLSTLHWRHTVGTWRVIDAERWEPLNGVPPQATDIVARISDGLDMDFARLESQRILIPPVLNYPSLPATMAGAAQAVLAGYFKTDRIEFMLPESVVDATPGTGGATPRSFASVSAAARECAFVASLDGRHCREACVAGYSLGTSIGRYIVKRSAILRR
jgi:hypothetical protein